VKLALALLLALPLAAQERTDCDRYFNSPPLVVCGEDRLTALRFHERIRAALQLEGAPLVAAIRGIGCDAEREDDAIRRFVVDDAFSMRELDPDSVVDLLETDLDFAIHFAILTTGMHTLRLTPRNVARLERLTLDRKRTLAARAVALGVLGRAGFTRLTERFAHDASDPLQESAAMFVTGAMSAEALRAVADDDNHVLQPFALWTLAVTWRLDSGERLCAIARDGARSTWVHDLAIHAMLIAAERGDAVSQDCLKTVKANRSFIVP